MEHVGLTDWTGYATTEASQIDGLLQYCQQWEIARDPEANSLPRAKRHDDKAIAAVRFDT